MCKSSTFSVRTVLLVMKKNAMMIIDFALAAEGEEGEASRNATYEACLKEEASGYLSGQQA